MNAVKRLQSEKGVSAVEFALMLPLLVLLVFGIIEFSVLLFDKAVLTNASREGARSGIVWGWDQVNDVYQPKTDAEIRQVIKDYANGHLVNLGEGGRVLDDGDIVISPVERNSEEDLTVTVTYPYNFLILPDISNIFGGNFDDTITLIGQTIMRME